jgi:anhydro-N-acetylmuramic acid kinase
MSGTSLDGVDAALASFDGAPRLVESHFVEYPSALREALLEAHAPATTIDEAARLANEVTGLYARAVNELVSRSGIRPVAVGCHGQTVRHEPRKGYTVQLVNGALLAEKTGLTAIVDFRSRDVAAGGQGAPLVPAFHAACFRAPDRARVVLNLGGIANVTYLPVTGPVLGFDTGPANILLDVIAQARLRQVRDEGGAVAASGRVIADALEAMIKEPYLAEAPPKSTGRDRFNADWLLQFRLERFSDADVLATLAEFTARTVSDAVARHCPGTTELYACGGGVHNADLMARLGRLLAPVKTATTASLGVDPDWVEAMAFAWLARQALERAPGNVSEVTGAAGPRVLGAIYPA